MQRISVISPNTKSWGASDQPSVILHNALTSPATQSTQEPENAPGKNNTELNHIVE